MRRFLHLMPDKLQDFRSIFYGVIVAIFLKESTWATPSEVISPYSSIQFRIRHIVQALRRFSAPNDRAISNNIWR